MLARVSRVVARKPNQAKGSQINKRTYASSTQSATESAAGLSSRALEQAQQYSEGAKPIIQVYKEQLAAYNAGHAELVSSIRQEFGVSASPSVQTAIADLTRVLSLQKPVPTEVIKPEGIDSILEVHGVSSLYADYMQAAVNLPYLPLEGTESLEGIFDPYVHVVRIPSFSPSYHPLLQ
jgi:hypothetical protein